MNDLFKILLFRQLGSVAGPVTQATGGLDSEDGLRSRNRPRLGPEVGLHPPFHGSLKNEPIVGDKA